MGTFMGELQGDILETHKALSDLNESMAQSLQASDKWTIASRFLSGTGLWAVQNKIRGVVSVIGEYQKGTTKMMESQKANAELLDKLAMRNDKLAESQAALTLATKGTIQIDNEYNAAMKSVNDASAALDIAKKSGKAGDISAARALLKLEEEKSSEASEQFHLAMKAADEIERMKKYYDGINIPTFDMDDISRGGSALSPNIKKTDAALDEDKIVELLDFRMKMMDKVAKEQEKMLTGGDEGKARMAMLEQLEMVTYNLDEVIGSKGGFGEEATGLEKDYIDATTTGERIANSFIGLFSSNADDFFGGDEKKELMDKKYQKRVLLLEGIKIKFLLKMQKFRDKLAKAKDFVKAGASLMGKALMWMPMVILTIFVIAAALREVWAGVEKGFEWFMDIASYGLTAIMAGFGDVWDGVSKIWEGIMEGNFLKVIWGMFEIAWGLVQIVWGIIVIAIGGFFGFIIGFILGTLAGWWSKGNSLGGSILRIVIGILTIFTVMKFLLALNTALTNPGMWGPVLIAGFVVAILAGAKYLLSKFDWFSKGGVATNRMAIVGEKGPEMVKLPAGARVKNNADTLTALRTGNVTNKSKSAGVTNNINVHVNGRVGASDSELRDIARKIGAQINREINRKTSSGTRA